MRKIALLLLVFGGLLFGGQSILLEAYQDAVIAPGAENIDTTILKLEFSLDTTCQILVASGGAQKRGIGYLLLDGDTVRNSIRYNVDANMMPLDQVFIHLTNEGEHTILLKFRTLNELGQCQYGRLQALIFLPDSASGVLELPPVLPPFLPSAVISRGPYVSAPGASAVVDASGRVMENVLSEGRVSISNLPAGTYFAKDEERTVVKIVKVD